LADAEPTDVNAVAAFHVIVAKFVPVAAGAELKAQEYGRLTVVLAGIVVGLTKHVAPVNVSVTLVSGMFSQLLGFVTLTFPVTFQPLSVTVMV
jgi:hypothetical protein